MQTQKKQLKTGIIGSSEDTSSERYQRARWKLSQEEFQRVQWWLLARSVVISIHLFRLRLLIKYRHQLHVLDAASFFYNILPARWRLHRLCLDQTRKPSHYYEMARLKSLQNISRRRRDCRQFQTVCNSKMCPTTAWTSTPLRHAIRANESPPWSWLQREHRAGRVVRDVGRCQRKT